MLKNCLTQRREGAKKTFGIDLCVFAPLREIFPICDAFASAVRMRDHVVIVDGTLSQSITGFFARTVELGGRERSLGYIRDGQLYWRTWQEVADAAATLAAELQVAELDFQLLQLGDQHGCGDDGLDWRVQPSEGFDGRVVHCAQRGLDFFPDGLADCIEEHFAKDRILSTHFRHPFWLNCGSNAVAVLCK